MSLALQWTRKGPTGSHHPLLNFWLPTDSGKEGVTVSSCYPPVNRPSPNPVLNSESHCRSRLNPVGHKTEHKFLSVGMRFEETIGGGERGLGSTVGQVHGMSETVREQNKMTKMYY